MIDDYCDLRLPVQYDLHWSIAYALIGLFGIFYAFLGNYCVFFLHMKSLYNIKTLL